MTASACVYVAPGSYACMGSMHLACVEELLCANAQESELKPEPVVMAAPEEAVKAVKGGGRSKAVRKEFASGGESSSDSEPGR